MTFLTAFMEMTCNQAEQQGGNSASLKVYNLFCIKCVRVWQDMEQHNAPEAISDNFLQSSITWSGEDILGMTGHTKSDEFSERLQIMSCNPMVLGEFVKFRKLFRF